MTDDYTYQAIEAKYDDMDAAKLNAMSAEERGEYYHSLYQYFGRMLVIVHEVSPAISEEETWPYSNIPQAEYWALSALGHAFHGLVDALAGLVDMAEKATDCGCTVTDAVDGVVDIDQCNRTGCPRAEGER